MDQQNAKREYSTDEDDYKETSNILHIVDTRDELTLLDKKSFECKVKPSTSKLTHQVNNKTESEESLCLSNDIDQTDGLIEDVVSVGFAAKSVYDEVVVTNKSSNNSVNKAKRVGTAVMGLLLAVIALAASVGLISEGSLCYIQNTSPTLLFNTSTRTLASTSHSLETLLCLSTQVMEGNSTDDSRNKDIPMDLKSPFTMMISGPTGSGKTQFTTRLMSDAENLSTHTPVEIIFCYALWQALYETFKNFDIPVTFHKGLISSDDLPTDMKHRWIVIDDLMREGNKDDKQLVTDLFTRESHHRNLSVIYITQNHFQKDTRILSINSHYLVVFKSPRDATTISNLAKQIFPKSEGFLQESYKLATRQPHSYLMLDMTQGTDERLRVLGRFREGEDETTDVYIPV